MRSSRLLLRHCSESVELRIVKHAPQMHVSAPCLAVMLVVVFGVTPHSLARTCACVRVCTVRHKVSALHNMRDSV